MTISAYYNEHDPFAAAWLRELIKDGHIAPGDVDERDIQDVTPNDLAAYTQVHCFAGTGGWSLALRLAGWPDDRPVWTGSAPCQPFSAAGTGGGFADERHLWPAWFWLIRQCRPVTIFGEQVSSKAGLEWWDVVAADLEAAGYGCGAFDLCAAGAGAFHIRQRLYFVADSNGSGQQRWRFGKQSKRPLLQTTGHVPAGVAQGDASGKGSPARQQTELPGTQPVIQRGAAQQSGSAFWANAVWLQCQDGKARPTEPGIFPLAHGLPNRVGTLRGAGNAIVPQLAAEFITAYMDIGA